MTEAAQTEAALSILGSIRLERIRIDSPVPLSYDRFSTESLLKTHLLPYLLPLKSERSLAYELLERDELKRAVGIIDGSVPARGTLWHFRQRNFGLFRCFMLRALAIVAIDAERIGVALPFVKDIDGCDRADGSEDKFIDPLTSALIKIYSPASPKPRGHQRMQNFVFPGFGLETERAEKRLLFEPLGFPVYVRWTSDSGEKVKQLLEPSWLHSPYKAHNHLVPHFPPSKDPYTACNVILLRKSDTGDELLLTQRLEGSGTGTYALPGGKKNPQESVLDCVKRELMEEVGIEFREGYPVSMRITNQRGFPEVQSIGIVATDWRGTPQRRERLAHGPWSWYKLTDLPSPLFFPTKMAIDDFLSNDFAALKWSDIEPEVQLPPLWRDRDPD